MSNVRFFVASIVLALLAACGGSVEGEPDDDGKATTLPVECVASAPGCVQ
jgi:hypothetical protein